MKTAIITLTLVVLFLTISGCGYFSSGNWTDDPDNWERAFQTKIPADVVVVHSQYWQSSHFTNEFRYFFEISANRDLEQQLLTENDLIHIEEIASWDVSEILNKAPDWFAVQPLENFEVYRYRDEAKRNFHVFIYRESRVIYLADYQY